MENDDKLLRQFFAENRQEPADDGFTRRVMERLPRRAFRLQRLERIWNIGCAVLCVAIFVALDGARLLWNALREVFLSMAQSAAAEQVDPKALLLAAVVLAALGCKKVASMV